jgi:hypothetical protein
MNNFTYRSPEEKDNLEAILKERRKQINRQQIIFGCILAGIVSIVALYIGVHLYYTEYDGYIHVDDTHVRTPIDVFVDHMYVSPGDVVMPGDTLYSYYMLDMFIEQGNLNNEPTVVVRDRDYQLRYVTTQQQISVALVRIDELKRQIPIEDHNIRFGLSDNAHKLDLERQLKEAEANLRALQNERNTIEQLRREVNVSVARSGYNRRDSAGMTLFNDYHSFRAREARVYRLATDTAVVINVEASDHNIFFEKESILTMRPLNLEGDNVQVIAYVPVDKMNKITNNTRATVIVNDDVEFRAHVSVLGLRTEEIPASLRSYFMKKNTAVMASFYIDKGQVMPFWAVTDGMPIKVRVKNTDSWVGYKTGDYLWFMSGRGVSEFSLKVFMIRQRLHKMRHEWISPQELEDMTSEDDFLRETESNSARRLREEIHDVQDGYEMPNHPEGFVPDEERASTSQWGTYDGNFNQQQEGQR